MAISTSKPIGNPMFAPFFLRISLGLYFLMAGKAKLHSIPAFVDEVNKIGILPHPFGTLYGTVLPFAEVAAGFLLIVGLWTTVAALITSLMLVSFVVALGIKPTQVGPFNKDLILLSASLAVMYLGAGFLSVDKFRDGGGGGA